MTGALHPILAETRLTLAEAAARLPPVGGKPRSVASLRAWVSGVKVGERTVRLDAVKVGRQWWTSAEAVGRFLAASSAATGPAEVQTPAERSAAVRAKKSRILAEFAEARRAARD
jgi:hypothetical protein